MNAWSLALGVGQLLGTRVPEWKQRGPDLKHCRNENTKTSPHSLVDVCFSPRSGLCFTHVGLRSTEEINKSCQVMSCHVALQIRQMLNWQFNPSAIVTVSAWIIFDMDTSISTLRAARRT